MRARSRCAALPQPFTACSRTVCIWCRAVNSLTGFPTTGVTVAVWVRLTDATATTAQMIFTYGSTTQAAHLALGVVPNTGSVVADIFGMEYTVTGSASLYDGNWHLLGFQFAGSNGASSVYVDGTMTVSGTGPVGSFSSSGCFVMGQFPASGATCSLSTGFSSYSTTRAWANQFTQVKHWHTRSYIFSVVIVRCVNCCPWFARSLRSLP